MAARLEGSRFGPCIKVPLCLFYDESNLETSKQAAPGNYPARCFAHRVYSVVGIERPIELPHIETFPGAACC